MLSTKSSLESLATRFLLASFLTGELVVELLEDSGVFSLFLFLVDDLSLVSASRSLFFFVVVLALVEAVDEITSSTLFPSCGGEDEQTDLDLFSDVSSANSINGSKLLKGSLVDNSTDSDSEEVEKSQDKTPSKSRIPRLKADESTTRRSSRSATSSPATSSSRVSRGSR